MRVVLERHLGWDLEHDPSSFAQSVQTNQVIDGYSEIKSSSEEQLSSKPRTLSRKESATETLDDQNSTLFRSSRLLEPNLVSSRGRGNSLRLAEPRKSKATTAQDTSIHMKEAEMKQLLNQNAKELEIQEVIEVMFLDVYRPYNF